VGDEAPGAVGGGSPAVEELTAAIEAHPLPAAVLCQLLRRVGDLDVATGLLMESLAYATLQAGPDHRAWVGERRAAGTARASAPDDVAVNVERVSDRLSVELDRPGVRNALDATMRDQLVAAFDLAAADRSVASVVLTGAGPSFCAGGDLSEFGTTPDPATAHAVRSLRLPARSIARIADRVHAVVHGASVGAGVELAAFAWEVEATADATFLLPEIAMGLVPGSGGTVSLPRRIGRQRTGWLALSGRRLGAADALAWGLVDRIGPTAGREP
jgi:enoyl-CoA hydratase/carnithine racemase